MRSDKTAINIDTLVINRTHTSQRKGVIEESQRNTYTHTRHPFSLSHTHTHTHSLSHLCMQIKEAFGVFSESPQISAGFDSHFKPLQRNVPQHTVTGRALVPRNAVHRPVPTMPIFSANIAVTSADFGVFRCKIYR